MARRDALPSRGLLLRTFFCLLCTLGFVASASAATFQVTNTSDSTTIGSLRWAITQANNTPGSIIAFASGVTGTITLSSPLPAITVDMTITGPGASSLTVSGNNSSSVGTIFTIDSGATIMIFGLTISNGKVSGNGGGILNTGTLAISNCAISNNSATSNGGGIYNDGALTVSGSTISGNTATATGGGIANENGATTAVVNSTFNGNTAIRGSGGAIASGSSTLSVTMSTVSANSAGSDGGGIFISAADPVTLTNSIVASNTAQTSDDISGTFTDGGGNVITPSSPIKLGALDNFGGPTQTMLPQPGSPAICAGDATKVPSGTSTDQRGFPISAAKYCTSGQIDSGAVQTNYTSIQFTNKGTSGYEAYAKSPVGYPANPIVSVTENGQNQGGVPVTLTFDGTGTPSGLGPVTTVAGLGATFTNIQVTETGSDTLDAPLTPTNSATAFTDSAALKIIPITLSPTTLPGATLQASYSEQITASGLPGSAFTFSFIGSLPAGLQLSTAGLLHGAPTATGNFSFTVTAKDTSNGASGIQTYTLTVNTPVSLTTTKPTITLTAGQGNVSLMPVTVTPNTGTPPYTYNILPVGPLPAGMGWDSMTGTLHGSPTAAFAQATYTVTVTDANGSQASPQKFTLTVNSQLTITYPSPSVMWTVGQGAVNFPATLSGGTSPLSFSIEPAASTLPTGLSFNSTTAAISGTPMSATTAPLTYTVKVTDVNNATATAMFTLTINAATTATTNSPSARTLTVNQAASFTPVAGSNGTQPLTYSISPTLPTGLTLNQSNGAITGADSSVLAMTNYIVTVTDANKVAASSPFSLTVGKATTSASVTSSSLNNTSTVNDSVTFTAIVTPFSGTTPISSPYTGAATVSGTTTFYDNGNTICASSPVSVVNSNGILYYEATCTTAALNAATSGRTISAVYNGNTNYSSSTNSNNGVTQTVNPASSSSKIASSLNPSVVSNPNHFNDAVTLTATVTPNAAPVALTGEVAFTDGGNAISGCSAVSVTKGVATCQTTFTSNGIHVINAAYGNDSNYIKSDTTKSPLAQNVQDYSIALVTNGTVTVSAGYTTATDPVLPRSNVEVTSSSVQGFATASGNPLTISCLFTQSNAPVSSLACQSGLMLAVSPSGTGQLPLTIDATNAAPGQYSLQVTAVDPTTGLSHSAHLSVYVSYISPSGSPVSVAAGGSTSTTFNFVLPAGVGSIPVNCNYTLIAGGSAPQLSSNIPLTCTLSPTTIGSTTSTSAQSIPVTLTITASNNMAKLMTKSNVFLASLLGIPILAVIGYISRRRKSGRSFIRFLSVIFMLGLILQNVGCGGSFNRSSQTTTATVTPVGSYYVIVEGPGNTDTAQPYSKQPHQAVIQVNVTH